MQIWPKVKIQIKATVARNAWNKAHNKQTDAKEIVVNNSSSIIAYDNYTSGDCNLCLLITQTTLIWAMSVHMQSLPYS